MKQSGRVLGSRLRLLGLQTEPVLSRHEEQDQGGERVSFLQPHQRQRTHPRRQTSVLRLRLQPSRVRDSAQIQPRRCHPHHEGRDLEQPHLQGKDQFEILQVVPEEDRRHNHLARRHRVLACSDRGLLLEQDQVRSVDQECQPSVGVQNLRFVEQDQQVQPDRTSLHQQCCGREQRLQDLLLAEGDRRILPVRTSWFGILQARGSPQVRQGVQDSTIQRSTFLPQSQGTVVLAGCIWLCPSKVGRGFQILQQTGLLRGVELLQNRD